MKTLLFIFISLFTFTTFGHVIEGTLIPEGTVRDKITVNSVRTTCKVKIKKVTNNLKEEDSYGNPAYQVKAEISLSGSHVDHGRIKLKEKVVFSNLFKHGNHSKVEDLKYFVPGKQIFMTINSRGHIEELQIPYKKQTIKCRF